MRPLSFALALCLLPAVTAGQSLVQPPPHSSVSLEALHPSFADEDDISLISGAYFLGGRFELRPGLALVAELPFGYVKVDSDIADESSSTLGNPLLGVVLTRGSTELGLAARAPLASEDEFAALFGVMSDQYRLEAFVPNAAAVQATARMTHMASDVTRLGFDLGSVLLIPTEDGDVEVFVDYGASAAYVAERFRAGLGLNGRALLTEDSSDLGGKTEHQAALFADFGSGRVRPGVSLRLPLDEQTREVLDMTFGLSLQYLMP